MNRNDQDAVVLSGPEAYALLLYLAVRHLRNSDWLEWEDVPNLSDDTFEMMASAMDVMCDAIAQRIGHNTIDAAWLHEEATR